MPILLRKLSRIGLCRWLYMSVVRVFQRYPGLERRLKDSLHNIRMGIRAVRSSSDDEYTPSAPAKRKRPSKETTRDKRVQKEPTSEPPESSDYPHTCDTEPFKKCTVECTTCAATHSTRYRACSAEHGCFYHTGKSTLHF